MNELQILYGYLRLNKPDKAVDVVDRIRQRMEQDSRISQIGIPELASYLLSFRTICDNMRLDVNIPETLNLERLPYSGERLAKAVIGMVNVFRFRATSPISGENVLKLVLTRSDKELRFVFSFDGEFAALESVQPEMEKCVEGIGAIDKEDPTASGQSVRTVVVIFPLST